MVLNRGASPTVCLSEVDESASNTLIEDARTLLLEYGEFVLSHAGAARFCFGTLQGEADRLPRSYREQGGGCLIACVDGVPAGFVAWRSVPGGMVENAWEMKRLWVRPMARGLKLGRTLAKAVLERAAANGRRAVYLDTMPDAMESAHALYLSLGFVPCAAYAGPPEEGVAYFVKPL